MQLKNVKLVFKDNHVISKGQRNVNNLKDNFIDSLIEKLDDRFPAKDSNLIFSFGVLGMRPLSFMSKDELSTWGDEKIETLITHFGKEQTHKYSDKISKATPLIEVSKGAKIRNRYNQVPHLTQDTNGKVTNSQQTPQTRAKRSALSQQVTTKHT